MDQRSHARLWAAPDILCDMPPTPADPGPARPPADINREIRALVAAGLAGSDEYAALLEEWLRATVVPAA